VFHVVSLIEEFVDLPTVMNRSIIHYQQYFVVRILSFYLVQQVQKGIGLRRFPDGFNYCPFCYLNGTEVFRPFNMTLWGIYKQSLIVGPPVFVPCG
jgi:hypothetical protein